MVSFLNCIERVPSVIEQILVNRKETFQQLLQSLENRNVDEIILIGSGTSNTAAVTARPFVEKASGLRTTQVTASEFLHDRFVRNPNAIYVFTSQTGTSKIVREGLNYCRTNGFLTVGISESSETPLSKEAAVFVTMGCGYEEYPMRTIGY